MKLYTHRLNETQLSEKTEALIVQIIKEQHSTGQYLQLDYDTRQRSRFKTTTQNGNNVGIDLERTQTIKQGNILATDKGLAIINQSEDDLSDINRKLTNEIIQVLAKPQTLTKVSTDDSFLLMRSAYHLGNRHVPLMVTPEALYFEPDHVLSEMLVGLGVNVKKVQAGFEPESGAYAGDGQHSHSHGHHHHHHGQGHHHTHNREWQNSKDFHPQDLISANFQFMG